MSTTSPPRSARDRFSPTGTMLRWTRGWRGAITSLGLSTVYFMIHRGRAEPVIASFNVDWINWLLAHRPLYDGIRFVAFWATTWALLFFPFNRLPGLARWTRGWRTPITSVGLITLITLSDPDYSNAFLRSLNDSWAAWIDAHGPLCFVIDFIGLWLVASVVLFIMFNRIVFSKARDRT